MPTHHEQAVESLRNKLLTMASHAETAVSRAVRSLAEQDNNLARQVEADDDILDRFEMEIDETAVNLLARAPLASELRLITVAMKISHELERVGDTATTIARRAVKLNLEPSRGFQTGINTMCEIGLGMLRDALDAFVNRDLDQARAVIPRDKEVDALNKQLHEELTRLMMEQPGAIPGCLHLMVVSKSLERIGDHAKNVAEDVVYLYEGRDIRHAARAAEPDPKPAS